MRNKDSVHIVIDIETLGTIDSLLQLGGCPILEAAFVIVEYQDAEFKVTRQLAMPFSFNDQDDDDLYIDSETEDWHQKMNLNYQNQIERYYDVHFCASEFRNALFDMYQSAKNSGKTVHFWSKGKDFDFTILKDYALKNGITYPFMEDYNFTKTHCLRDLIYFTGFDEKTIANPNPHDALSDALTEAKILAEILNKD